MSVARASVRNRHSQAGFGVAPLGRWSMSRRITVAFTMGRVPSDGIAVPARSSTRSGPAGRDGPAQDTVRTQACQHLHGQALREKARRGAPTTESSQAAVTLAVLRMWEWHLTTEPG